MAERVRWVRNGCLERLRKGQSDMHTRGIPLAENISELTKARRTTGSPLRQQASIGVWRRSGGWDASLHKAGWIMDVREGVLGLNIDKVEIQGVVERVLETSSSLA